MLANILNIFLNEASPYYAFNMLIMLTIIIVGIAAGGMLLVSAVVKSMKKLTRKYRRNKVQSSR